MMTGRTNMTDCGAKHLKLAAMIIGLVTALCGSTVLMAYSMVDTYKSDTAPRLRHLEQNYGRIDERLKSIQADLKELKALKETAASL